MEFHGTAVSEGIVLGRAFLFRPYVYTVEERRILPDEVTQQIKLFEEALLTAEAELIALIDGVQTAKSDLKEILTAHLMILKDPEILAEIRVRISQSQCCVIWAIQQVYDEYIGLLDSIDDPHIRERASDMVDVRTRLIRCVQKIPDRSLAKLPEPCIVFAEELLPSDTVMMDPDKVLGIVAEKGGATSHMAIIARSLGIPAVLGVKGILECVPENAEVILDAVFGRVLISPDANTVRQYMEVRDRQLRKKQTTQKYLQAEAVTKDGIPVEVELNVGSIADNVLDNSLYTDGIGLFRSEFLYMESSQLPDEESQFRAYRAALEAFRGKPVVLRTLDIGGDKRLPYMELPQEENPFLGVRALRLCFAHPDIFRTQLRAALRASIYGDLWLMFPMVSSLEDFHRAKAYVNEVQRQLRREGIPFREDIRLGIMIEVPSAALTAELFAMEVDFASIGTNDLVQYLTASDRMNSEVASYYQNYHPAVLRVIRSVIAAFDQAGKPICVCGELGGTPMGVLALLGLGLRRFSVSPANIAAVKQVIIKTSAAEAKTLTDRVLTLGTAEDTSRSLEQYLSEHIYQDEPSGQPI